MGKCLSKGLTELSSSQTLSHNAIHLFLFKCTGSGPKHEVCAIKGCAFRQNFKINSK